MASQRTFWQSFLDYIRGETPNSSSQKITFATTDDEQETKKAEEFVRAYDTSVYPDLDKVRNLRPGQAHLHGQITRLNSRYVRAGLYVTEGVFSDETGSARLVWFNQRVQAVIKSGAIYEVRGSFELKRQRFQFTNPKFRLLSEGCESFEKPKEQKAVTLLPVTPQHNIWTSPIEGRRLSSDSKWKTLKTKVLIRDNYTCAACGGHINLTVDHKIELSLGGTNAMSNLQVLCKECHEDKHFRNFLDRKFDAVDDYGVDYEPTVKIKTLSDAIKSGVGVSISYKDREGISSYRIIHPKRMYKGYRYKGTVVNKRMVYVDAYCELDQAGRTFRISRMKLVPQSSETGTAANRYT